MLRYIERATRSPSNRWSLTVADVNEQRVARFRQRITEALAAGQGEPFLSLVEEYERDPGTLPWLSLVTPAPTTSAAF